jgi:NMD protein affecting ribosome stability and mRNA decay
MPRERSKTHPAASQPRIDRVLHSQEADAYGLGGKLPDPTACPDCGALYRAGRWTWGAAPRDAHRTACPACRRIAYDYPAGIVTLSGSFHAAHRQEIEGLVRHVEEREKKEHALKRVMAIREDGDDLVITTTDVHLARGIGEAIQSAYKGELDYTFTERENVMRVRWRR